MTEGNHHKKTFTAEDIRRYHSGEMPDAEMHALEKMALEDPFLADAMDGFLMHGANSEQELATLERRLHKRIVPEKKRRAVPYFRIAAAAMIFLVAGSLTILFFLSQGNNAGPEIIVKNKSEDVFPVPAEPRAVDSVLSAPVAMDKVMLKREAKPDVAPMQPKQATVAPAEAKANLADVQTMMQADDQKNEVAKALPAPAAPDSNRIAVNRSITAQRVYNDSVINRSTPLEEVVVVGYGVQKKRSVVGSVVNTSTMTPADVAEADATFRPSGSWSEYSLYLRTELQKKTKEKSGSYRVQFRVSPNGAPTDIKILESSRRRSNALITRLIQNGPAWQVNAGADSTVKVVIRF